MPDSNDPSSSPRVRPVLHPMSRAVPAPSAHKDPLCRVVLVEPLIPENTGNISRTCVGTESELHLVEPMGFEITEKRVRRAGLDYWDDLSWQQHKCYREWRETVPNAKRIFFIETGGEGTIFDADFQRGDYLVFGKETTGLLPEWLAAEPDAHACSIPMPGRVRSLNLSNAVAVTVFELMRQVLSIRLMARSRDRIDP